MTHLTLLTRSGCHLCDEMKAVIAQVRRTHVVPLTEVDIATQPTLEDRWGEQIPVLLRGDRVIARHRITASQLEDEVVNPNRDD